MHRHFYKLHTFAADKLPWVQYPHVRPIGQRGKVSFWKYRMRLGDRMALASAALIVLITLLTLTGVFLLCAWAFWGAALGFH